MPARGIANARLIHRGRRFQVFRGLLERDGRHVVAKVATTPASSEALRRELELLERVAGPGVARPVGLDSFDGRPALILEDAGPENLAQWLERGPLPLETFLHVAISLAETLTRIHDARIVHRDISPENVVMCPPHEPTLVDFDLATDVVAVVRPGPIDALEGTLATMSPEQTGRVNRVVDARSDLYSLGVTFFAMLTGSLPFSHADPAELLQAHLTRPAPLASDVAPQVPSTIASIVDRLLAKAPEARYQSARALAEDLRTARTRWYAHRTIEPFELGVLDRTRELVPPQTLYGRRELVAAADAAYLHARSGGRAILTIRGEAGAGKTAALDAIAARLGGAVVRVRFTPSECAPYSVLAAAFGARLAAIAREPLEASMAVRRTIADALGANAAVLAEMIPELRSVVSPIPPALPARPGDDALRLRLTFAALARALASVDKPLVLAADDVHWADSASLDVLRAIASDEESTHVLVILTSRDGTAERLATEVSEHAKVFPCTAGPLSVEDVTAYVADALASDRDRVRPLAQIVHRHSAGLPLYVQSVLRALTDRGLLRYDDARGGWTWNLVRIAALPVPDRAVSVLVAGMRRLPADTQQALGTAACIGLVVELGLLAKVLDTSVDDAARRLWEAVRAGSLAPDVSARGDTPVYRFTHDRIRDAAYQLVPRRKRGAIHLRVGRAMLEMGRAAGEGLFAIVEQLERGADHLRTDAERLELAELEQRAGRRALAAAAHEQALDYFTHAIEHLPEDAWSSAPDFAFDVHRDAIECCHVLGKGALLEALATCAEAQRLSTLQRAELATIRVAALTKDGLLAAAVQRGREGLALLGVTFPLRVSDDEVVAMMTQVENALRARGLESLLDASEATDPHVRARSVLLAEIAVPLFFHDPRLSMIADAKILLLALEHGVTPETSRAVFGLARFLVEHRRWDEADRLGRLAQELARRSGDAVRHCETLTNVAMFVRPWRAPLRASLPLLQRAYELGVGAGGMNYASYARTSAAVVCLAAGEPLAAVEAEASAAVRFAERVGSPISEVGSLLVRQEARCLRGLTRTPYVLDDDEYSDAEIAPIAARNPLTAHTWNLTWLRISLFMGRFEQARDYARAVARYAPYVRGTYAEALVRFLGAVARAATMPEDVHERARSLARLHDDHADLAAWAEAAPESFAPMERGIAAEIARVEGRIIEAADLYDRAIELAAEQRTTHWEAFLSERAASNYAERRRARSAALYLAAARDAYARWGATSKVRLLDTAPPIATLPWRAEAATRTGPEPEVTSIRRAADEIVGTLAWETLVDRTLAATRDLSGATRAALVLAEDGRLTVRGVLSEGQPRATLMQAPVDPGAPLAASVVERAFRTGEAVHVADTRASLGTDDPYVESHDVRSILAVPLQRQAVRTGVLYLEHRTGPRVFTVETIAALSLLSPQIATALENAVLFEKLRHEIEERRRAESSVRFLSDAGVALVQSLESPNLAHVATIAVQRVADYCAMDLVERGELRRVAEAYTAGTNVVCRDTARTIVPVPGAPMHAARDGRSAIVTIATDTDPCRLLAVDDVDRPSVAELSLRTVLSVPIGARGQVLGTLTLARSRRRPPYVQTDLRLAEELALRISSAIENARLYEAAREAIRLRDEFLSVASHELRGPLSALQLTLQGLSSGLLPNLPPEAKRPIELAERQTVRLGRLVDELLDVSRLRAGKLFLRLEPVGLADLVTDVAERFEGEAEKAGCALEVDVPRGVVGHWDPSRLGQVLENLVSNAIKFGRGKPITIRGEVENGLVRLSVRDRGVGIPSERVPFIFDRFERAVSPEHFGGLGLGLYIVREIVGALGGRVRVDSVESEGSTFTVELPLRGPTRVPAREQQWRSA